MSEGATTIAGMDWLERTATLRQWTRSGTRAPHKPLLFLYALGRFQQDADVELRYSAVEEDLQRLLSEIGKDEARQARRLLADAKLHGHKYAIDAVLAVVARQQKGQVTVFTSDVDDLERLAPESIVVRKV